jgi:hypothetical protein
LRAALPSGRGWLASALAALAICRRLLLIGRRLLGAAAVAGALVVSEAAASVVETYD